MPPNIIETAQLSAVADLEKALHGLRGKAEAAKRELEALNGPLMLSGEPMHTYLGPEYPVDRLRKLTDLLDKSSPNAERALATVHILLLTVGLITGSEKLVNQFAPGEPEEQSQSSN
ncbi:hypothetical protein FQN50_009730 [Emmonsiellopsis sp. PD_5]|nr:hypothetical protein FQN50_009730 [Emmonsiellopsis sp. PD_5]